jgi:hypothetical protein
MASKSDAQGTVFLLVMQGAADFIPLTPRGFDIAARMR